MSEFLLELLSEEIPARMQARAAADLQRLIVDHLDKAGLGHGDAKTFVTPRRLAVAIDGLADRQADTTEEKRGPKVGAPDQALQGFLKANGLESADQAEVRETPKGSFYFAVRSVRGRATDEVLAEVVQGSVARLGWPKSMRWGGVHGFAWVRPLHAVLAIFDGKALPGGLDLGGAVLPFTAETQGHRFLAPERFGVVDSDDYASRLREAKVLVDPQERRAVIVRATESLTAAQNLAIKEDQGLLDEVVGLVEWPIVLMGTIDTAFMELPPEVLSTAMRSHQKYFSVLDAQGRFANRFIFVANMETADGGATIVAGNERVLTARLADARFFWDQDRKQSLASRAPALSEIVFHAKLGTLDSKVDRVEALAECLCDYVPGADRDRVRSAARLAKADLTTGMVGEFPELQGVMGRYYALADDEAREVAQAVQEHYAPLGPNDLCPSAPVSVVVALADKIDTLVGFWRIDEKPTGSKDPFALRRAALGVIRLILENGLRLPLMLVLQQADRGLSPHQPTGGVPEHIVDLLAFFAERLKVVLRDKGVRHDLISAVFAIRDADGYLEGDLVRLLARVEALGRFLDSDDGANLLVAFRRAANIVRIEEKKDKTGFGDAVEASLLQLAEEKQLFDALQHAKSTAKTVLVDENFTAAMEAMAGLRRPVDAFFDEVTVNADDPGLRANRLRLLSSIGGTLGQVADFSKIDG